MIVLGAVIVIGSIAVIGIIVLVWRSRSDITKLTPTIGGSEIETAEDVVLETERKLNEGDEAKQEI